MVYTTPCLAHHPFSADGNNNDADSFMGFKSDSNADEVLPHEPVLSTAWRRPSTARQTYEAQLPGLTHATIPRPEPRDSARLPAASSASRRGMRMCIVRGSENRASFDLQMDAEPNATASFGAYAPSTLAQLVT